MDGGFDAAFKFIKNHFSTLLPSIGTSASNYDYKSQLQEIVQVSQRVTPFYKVIQESGPDHDKTFIVQINVGEFSIKGVGKSKKWRNKMPQEERLRLWNWNNV